MTPFETFLTQLAPLLQFPSLSPDAKGACLIIMKEGNVLLLFEFDEQLVPNTVLLSSLLCSIPQERRAEVYEALLIGNQTIEETLSAKPDEDLLYLHQRFHPAIEAAALEKELSHFLEQERVWREKIAIISASPPRLERILPHPSSIQVFPYKA